MVARIVVGHGIGHLPNYNATNVCVSKVKIDSTKKYQDLTFGPALTVIMLESNKYKYKCVCVRRQHSSYMGWKSIKQIEQQYILLIIKLTNPLLVRPKLMALFYKHKIKLLSIILHLALYLIQSRSLYQTSLKHGLSFTWHVYGKLYLVTFW